MGNWECWKQVGHRLMSRPACCIVYKYKIFAEQGDTPDITVLIISQQRQTRIDDNAHWLDQDKDSGLERQFVSDLSLFIDAGKPAGRPAPVVASDEAAGSSPRAGPGPDLRVVDAGEGKMYLTIPEAFEQAWKNTGIALRNSGLQITGGMRLKAFIRSIQRLCRAGRRKAFSPNWLSGRVRGPLRLYTR